jgi:hypothetical protein
MSNKIKIVSEKIGEFEIVVNDKQLDKLINEGAKTLDQIRKEESKRKWRRPGDSFGSENTEGGFSGNDVDWSKYFPNVPSEEIDRMISEALKYERKIQATTSALLVLVGVGVTIAMTGNPVSALGLIKIVEIAGSYFSIGQEDDST